jgi:hypothetical protein
MAGAGDGAPRAASILIAGARRPILGLLIVAGLLVSGCAPVRSSTRTAKKPASSGSFKNPLKGDKSERERIKAAAEDKTFPTAAQLGLFPSTTE